MIRSILRTGLQHAAPTITMCRGISRRKTTQLKEMIMSNETEYIMEAHNALSAKVVEEAGKSNLKS